MRTVLATVSSTERNVLIRARCRVAIREGDFGLSHRTQAGLSEMSSSLNATVLARGGTGRSRYFRSGTGGTGTSSITALWVC